MELLKRFIPADHDWRTEGLILARNEVDYRTPVRLTDRMQIPHGAQQANRLNQGNIALDQHHGVVINTGFRGQCQT